MIQEIKTHVVDCDFPGCDERYADQVPVNAKTIEQFALRDGWVTFDGFSDAKHYCPKHAKEPHE